MRKHSLVAHGGRSLPILVSLLRILFPDDICLIQDCDITVYSNIQMKTSIDARYNHTYLYDRMLNCEA